MLNSNWTATTLEERKTRAIAVVTKELLADESIDAQLAVGGEVLAVTGASEDRAFISPDVTGSVLDGAPSFSSSGSAIADVDADLRRVVSLVPGSDRPSAAFAMSAQTATFLATLRDGGAAAFGNELGPQGGRLLGLPVLTTAALAGDDSPATNVIALLSPSEIFWHEGDISIRMSDETGLVRNTDPDATSPLISMFDADTVAFEVTRRAGWYARPGAEAYFTVPS